MKIKIEKTDEETTYRQVNETHTFTINGKTLRIYTTENSNDNDGSDYDIDENDRKALTDDEYDALDNIDMWELLRSKVGELKEVEIED